MAFIKNKNKYIQKVRIDFGTVMGEEKDEDVFVVLREPDAETMLHMADFADDEKKMFTFFKEILPGLIVDHNFYNDEAMQEKTSGVDIATIIFDTVAAASKVVTEYYNAAFFTRQQKTAE